MPTIHGLLETALYVTDVSRAAGFYQQLFGFETLLESERLIALDVVGRNVLLLFKAGSTDAAFETPGGVIPGHSGSGSTHLAFSISADEVVPWQERLESEGVVIESTVTWPGGGKSLYLRDLDDHLVELITPGCWSTY